MKVRIFFTGCFIVTTLIFSAHLAAQHEEKSSAIIRYYDTELFQWNFGFFNGLTLNYKNQNSIPAFGIKSSMKKALSQYQDTEKLYRSYRVKTGVGQFLIWTGVSALLVGAYLPMFLYHDDYAAYEENYKLPLYLMGGGLLAEIIGSFITISGQETIFNAVNTYNRHKIAEYN
ncbi:MAG: hypothetical protein LBD20_09420 [Spirochaetaceae bacterium]|jgi:hypothetical protein|nr:hypothetical protein [Spirochaetaceae bacterium]